MNIPVKDPYFFGYGSLVNARTHDYENVQAAKLKGWRRAWRASPLRAVCYLTAVPCAQSEIDGLLASVPGADWDALDHRERAYARVPLAGEVTHQAGDVEVAVYAISEGAHSEPTAENPVLLSYLDVVVQGYLHMFGRAGVDRFFATTDGWHAPIQNDRNAPIYPRAQSLTTAERALVDDWLASLPAETKQRL